MREWTTGIIHVHSHFSRDGVCSIGELADFAREAGFHFVCLTDHAEDLSPEDMKGLRQECETRSDESVVIIPGLEFRCVGHIHILGLGITDNVPSDDPVTVASQIGVMGGVAILAHPGRNGYQCSRELSGALHGIEIWNAAYDGRFVPPPASFRLLQEARTKNPAIFGFGGVDLHWFDSPPSVTIELPSNRHSLVSPQIVLDCLRLGSFVVRGRYVAFGADAVLNWPTRSSVFALRKFYDIATSIRDLTVDGVNKKAAS